MDKSPILSIIIPVYNSERTISQTLDSLTNNQYDIEILCINDGSTDGTESVIKKKMQHDNRIKLIIQLNGGASRARNAGIAKVDAEYIMFCDADDEYGSNVFDCIIDDIKLYDPDYIVFGRRTLFEDGTSYSWLRNKTLCSDIEYNWYEYFNNTIQKRRHSTVVYNRVYRTRIIQQFNVMFDESLKLSEDLYFNFEYLKHAKNMIEDGRAEYIQHKVANSMTTTKRTDFFEEDTKVLGVIHRQYRESVVQFQPFLNRHMLCSAVLAVDRALIRRDAHSANEAMKIIRGLLRNDDLRNAYCNYIECVDRTTKRKLRLLFNRQILAYWLVFIFRPRMKTLLLRYRLASQLKKQIY